jgi:hypothetical protein
VKETEIYGFPFPECAPPLVKDSSQIAQMATLAHAIDIEVQRVIDKANDALVQPPNTRVSIAVLPVATTANLVVPVFDTSVYQINWGGPSLIHNAIDIFKPGWYLVGCHALVSSATAAVLPMVRLTVNGSPASSWSAVGGNYGVGNGRLAALSAVPLLLAANDIVRMEIKHTAAGSPAWDYRPHLWAVQLVKS